MVPNFPITHVEFLVWRAECDVWIVPDRHISLHITYNVMKFFICLFVEVQELILLIIGSSSWHLLKSFINFDSTMLLHRFLVSSFDAFAMLPLFSFQSATPSAYSTSSASLRVE